MAKEKKGLGTGLGALFGDDIFEESSEQQILDISKIEPRVNQPRNTFDEAALNELADSIASIGIIQPIVVRKLDSGYFQIIAGERRWRAARIAGLDEVPVRIIDADDRLTAELALVENLQREDLNPVEEAMGYKTLMEEYGLTQEEMSRTVGKSRPVIANSVRLLSLSQPVLKMVEEGTLSAGHGKALVGIADGELQLQAANEIVSKSLNVRKAEQLASKLSSSSGKSVKKTPPAQGDGIDYAAEVSAALSAKLGRKVFLNAGRKSGKIEIEFYGDDDREELIALLMSVDKLKKGE